MASLHAFFVDRHGELRTGWRIALFGVIFTVVAALLLGIIFLLDARQGALSQGAVVLAALVAGWMMTRLVNRKPPGAIGLFLHPRLFSDLGTGLLLGFLMMAGIFCFELAAGFVSVVGRQPTVGAAVAELGTLAVDFSLAGTLEELLFRGYPFQTLMQGVGFLPASLLVSGLFALAHGFNPGITWLASFNIFLAGLWLSVAYMRSRSLWFPIALHIGWNFSQSAIFSFPTSGIDFSSRALFVLEQRGPDWLTGGAFGPEGGLVATVALLLGTWHILKSRRYEAPEGVITLDSLEDLLPAGPGGNGADGGRP